jgi:UDP-3-O-[3-hydroxymyristoyl] glucosamine N-acyltransferase
MEFNAATIAGFLKGEIVGDPEVKVNTIAKIEEGHHGALSFLANPKYEHYIYNPIIGCPCHQELCSDG